ncbi:preprotein translocase subunit SecA [Antarctobacter jejuensis]|uniref:preprotein translocase subunit SecA n=1 Tax=Antarctobacter jejuensis TaxID=1439938 RepID=UPI003FD29D17
MSDAGAHDLNSRAARMPRLRELRQMARIEADPRPVNWQYQVTLRTEPLIGAFRDPAARLSLRLAALRVSRIAARYRDRPLPELQQALADLVPRLRPDRLSNGPALQTLGLISAICHQVQGLTPFPTQIMGALAICSGRLVEMETGSGKTLTAALSAGLAGLSGESVHVVTANDYLAARDHESFSAFYEALGLTTGLVIHTVPPNERAPAYRARVLYASNKEIAFDYLRNRITLGGAQGPIRLALEAVHSGAPRAAGLTMNGLPFAIVDEADSVLIDECRTPLIISETASPDPDWAHSALSLADDLREGRDYTVDGQRRVVELTPRGEAKLADSGERLGGIWRNSVRRNHAAVQALSALHLFIRDEHYIVRDGKVALIDEFTGRVADDRALGDGLQQIVEAREGVEITGRRLTKGRMTYQRFFRRYKKLAGMTGTAREVAGEFRAVYGLSVLALPPPKRSRRKYGRVRIHAGQDAKWQAVARRAEQVALQGRPLLIATRTIRASMALEEHLKAAGLEATLLNAAQDADEAAIIAQAGEPGRITLATNMAGRGVDIMLTDAVRAAGGLHVILTEVNEAGRIDRQVLGRCARQGDPGSCEMILARDDGILDKFGSRRTRSRLATWAGAQAAQKRAERLMARARLDLLRYDLRRDGFLGFLGGPE